MLDRTTLIRVTDDLIINWLEISYIHRNDDGDVIVYFNKDFVRIPAELSEDFLAFMHSVSEDVTPPRAAENTKESGLAEHEDRGFADRFR